MKILVTGANGFIGSRFRSQSVGQKDTYIFADRMDIPTELPRIDAVMHLAGKPGGNWQDCMESNVLPTLEILRVMETHKIPHLVFMSSGSVYADTPNAIPEDAQFAPTTSYGASKVTAEIIIRDWVARKRISSATILRGNNIYGPGSDHGVVSHFIDRTRKGIALEVDGDGSQVREPVFVDDVIELAILALAKPPMGIATYNVSGSEFFTLKELAEHIALALGKQTQFKLTGKPALPPHTMRLDITRAQKDLGWHPRTLLREGIAKTIAS